VAASLLALLAAQVAFAHSRPIRFDPAPGAVLSQAPASVEGWFTAELRRDPNWTFLHVSDAQGNRVETGETELSADRLHLGVGLQSGLGPGRYIVTWRGFDDGDGAILGDCYTFFVGQQAADEAIASKARLDGGRDCQRIDVDATNGTPVAGGTPPATGEHGDGHGSEVTDPETGRDTEDDDGGVPVWALVLGVVAGVVVGGVGGRFIGGRS
jgi:methionine-rich copper-binding protein CopC